MNSNYDLFFNRYIKKPFDQTNNYCKYHEYLSRINKLTMELLMYYYTKLVFAAIIALVFKNLAEV